MGRALQHPRAPARAPDPQPRHTLRFAYNVSSNSSNARGRHLNSEDGGFIADIKPFARRITYSILHDIPASLFLLFILAMKTTAVATAVLGRASIPRLRQRVHQLSPRRIYTTYLFPHAGSLTMESREWKETHVSALVTLDSIGRADAMLSYSCLNLYLLTSSLNIQSNYYF